jgi:hypothetical protein
VVFAFVRERSKCRGVMARLDSWGGWIAHFAVVTLLRYVPRRAHGMRVLPRMLCPHISP